MSDYYKTLGVTKNATKDEIKKAYRKMAHKHHPDKGNSDSDKKFKEINEAYQVLSDEKKKAEYDTYGRVFNGGASGGAGQGFGGWDFSGFNGGQGGVDFDLSDIFENMFSGQRQSARAKRGRDISIDQEISFEESIFGVGRRILLSKMSSCQKCGGTGAEPGAKMETCATCQGAGKIHETKKSFLGAFTSLRECNKCDGKGSIPSKRCNDCKGRGVLKKNEEFQVKIPSGIQNGEMIRLSGGGEAVAGGVTGDLYIKIHVRPHPTFRREGNNITMDLDIKMSEAVLGVKREIKTLDGIIELKIPVGIDSGEILRVRGKGVPQSHGGRGDLMIRILVRTPHKISRHARKLIEDLKKEGL